MENPFFILPNVSLRRLEKFEYDDEKLPLKCQIIANVDRYIREHKEISERYYRLILAHEIDKCLPIITDVINASEIQSDSIKPKNVDCAYINIITCIMNSVSEVISEELLDTADKLM